MFPPANEDLDPEEAWSYDLTLSKRWLEVRLNTELSVFYTEGSNLIEVAVVEGRRSNRNVGAFKNKGVEFSASWRALDNLIFNANYSFLDMGTILIGAPVHKAYVSGTWNLGKFSVNLGAMGIKDLYLTAGDNTRTSEYVDLKCRLSWKATPWLTLFARGENLLDSKYETMDGFPEPGVTAFGGLSISL